MQSFETLLKLLETRLAGRIFPERPENLYDPARYILRLGGKRIRPVLCMMGSELLGDLSEDTFRAAIAIELFHNFTLVHDDIMDEAPLRRGHPTVHSKVGTSNALLSGDVMLVQAYEELSRIKKENIVDILQVFNQTAKEVCEGQQLDMDLAGLPLEQVKMKDYLCMITLKTSVLLAASLQIGGMLGAGTAKDLENMYAFGKNVGIAFQIQDDYLDAFGDYEKFGKQIGGDILANKKTFLLIKAYELAEDKQKEELLTLLNHKDKEGKVKKVLSFYRAHEVDQWAQEKKDHFVALAKEALDNIRVVPDRKRELEMLMTRLLNREN